MSFDLDPTVVTGFQPPTAACSEAQVMVDATPCASVGDGSMTFQVLGLTENLTLSAFQSTDPQALLILVDGLAPLAIHQVLVVQKALNANGSTHWDIAVTPVLQEPAPGVYATFTDFNVTLRSTIALSGCPASSLTFATHSDFAPKISSADAMTQTACQVEGPAAVPSNTAAPTITGQPTVGETLSGTSGAWSGQTPMNFGYQWQRCSPSCSPIAGATASSYSLIAADQGAAIAVTVTASNTAGTAQATSSQLGPVTPSSGQVRAALVKALAVAGPGAKLGQLLKRGGYAASIDAPGAGQLVIGWFLVPKGAHLTKTKRPTLVASFRAALGGGKAKVKIALNGKGRKLVKQARRLKLTAKGSFTPTGATTTTTIKTIALKR
jgi:hypothetical protein